MKNKNGNNELFNVKKSFTLGDNEIVVMEGDQLKYISTDRNKDTDKIVICFEVINSFWCEDVMIETEINLTPQQVADYLIYDKIIH